MQRIIFLSTGCAVMYRIRENRNWRAEAKTIHLKNASYAMWQNSVHLSTSLGKVDAVGCHGGSCSQNFYLSCGHNQNTNAKSRCTLLPHPTYSRICVLRCFVQWWNILRLTSGVKCLAHFIRSDESVSEGLPSVE